MFYALTFTQNETTPEMSDTNGLKKRHVAHRREIRFFRAMFLTSVLSQTEGGNSIHRIF